MFRHSQCFAVSSNFLTNCRYSSVFEKKRLCLPADPIEPFIALKREVIAKKGIDMKSFSMVDTIRRMPNFTDEDWRRHIIGLGSGGQYYPKDQATAMLKFKDGAIDWFLRNRDTIEAIDFFIFVRFIGTFQAIFYGQKEPRTLVLNIVQWFLDKHEDLQPDAFFDILNTLKRFLFAYFVQLKDVVVLIAHGTKLAKHGDISSNLYLLHLIQCLEKRFDQSKLRALEDENMRILSTQDLPFGPRDLRTALNFIADTTAKKTPNYLTRRSVFRRLAQRPHVHDPWKWLRNSIELVFSDEGNLHHMRQMAALAAVRAYKWKALDLSPMDVNRYLEIAAEPYLTNPAILFQPCPDSIMGKHYVVSFAYLLTAIRSAVGSDLPERKLLTVQLDEEYWKKLFATIESEMEKLNGTRSEYLGPLWVHIGNHTRQLTARETMYLSPPMNPERYHLMKRLVHQYATVIYDPRDKF